MAAEDDPPAPADALAFAGAHDGPGRVIIYETGGHGTDMFGDHPELADALLEFVKENA